MLVRYAPGVVFELPPGIQTLGLEGFRGHAGAVEALRKLGEAWETFELELAYVTWETERCPWRSITPVAARAASRSTPSSPTW